MRTFLIDTDTASDDAVALIMALRHRDVHVAAITTVAGNVPIEQATANALYTAEMCASDVPVYRGAEKPLMRANEHAHWFHGADGMGNQHYPPSKLPARDGDAVDAIIETARNHRGLTLVTLGPLTNIALALGREPAIASNVARCVVMGGNPCCEGNVTPAAEYNIWVDPEAAQIVFRSGMPIEMIGWQLCRGEASLSPQEMRDIRAIGSPLAAFAMDCNRTAVESNYTQTGEIGLALADPVAMAVALEPEICRQSSAHRVEIQTSSELTRGMTVVDRLNVANDERNHATWHRPDQAVTIRVCWSIDVPAWKRLLIASLR